MKNKKKWMSLVLASAMAVTALAGCGSSADDKGSSDSGEAVFKIGGTGPLTGDYAIYGKAVQNGIELAAKEINEAGGINGVQIEYKFEDDEADAEKAVNAYNTLKDWGMQIMVGATTSGACESVVAETANDNMFQLTPSGTSLNAVQYDNAFRMCFSDPAQGTVSAQYIAKNNLAKKIAVIYDSSNTYSSGIYENFAKEAKNQGLEVVSAEAFTAESNKDFSVQLQKAKDNGAEMVFLPIYYQEASLILAKAKEMGYAPVFFGCDGMDGILSLNNFDTSLAEGLMLMTPFSADAEDEKTQNFVKAYEEAYGDTPNQFAADAYDAVYVVKAAAEKAELTPDMSASDMCDALKGAMTEITFDGLTGKSITWEANGEPKKDPIAVKIEGGKYVFM